MNDMERSENMDSEKFGSYSALLVAFKTMNERCQQLQSRLSTVEEENMCLRLECGKDKSATTTKPLNNSEKSVVDSLKEKIEELKEQKSQLTHQVFMVAAENRQLWKRLTKLTRTNKTLGSHLTKISDTLKEHSPVQPSELVSFSCQDISDSTLKENADQQTLLTANGDKDLSLEEISLRLINSIMLEKSDLEQQYLEMVELQNNTGLDLRNIGFTYPEDSDTDLELFKQHDMRLSQMKNNLLAQQTKLKRALQNFKRKKKGLMCNTCRTNANKKMCNSSTQFNFNETIKEHGSTQTSLQPPSLPLEKSPNSTDVDQDNKICPLCGSYYGKSITFAEFHEHVLGHFTEEMSVDGLH